MSNACFLCGGSIDDDGHYYDDVFEMWICKNSDEGEVDMDDLFDKIMDNEELTEEEVEVVNKLKSEEITEDENEVYQMFEEQDDFTLDYNPIYFSNIQEKNKVLAKIRFKELEEDGE
jgi:hypothetical protein